MEIETQNQIKPQYLMNKLPHYQKLGLARNKDTEKSTRLIREDQIGTKTKQNSHNKPSKSSSI